MMRRTLLPGLLALLLATPSVAHGQFGRRGEGGDPRWWLSGWGGYQWGNVVSDPRTNSNWAFDQNWSTRFTIEREITSGVTAGIAYGYSRMPLTLQGLSGGGAICARCEAEATLATYGATLRSGVGRRGLHLVYEGFVGAMQYSNFTVEGAAASSAPDISNTDFAYAFGIGAGYSLARDWELLTVFETLSAIHERSDNVFSQRTARHYTLRAGVRVGF